MTESKSIDTTQTTQASTHLNDTGRHIRMKRPAWSSLVLWSTDCASCAQYVPNTFHLHFLWQQKVSRRMDHQRLVGDQGYLHRNRIALWNSEANYKTMWAERHFYKHRWWCCWWHGEEWGESAWFLFHIHTDHERDPSQHQLRTKASRRVYPTLSKTAKW